MPIGVAQPWTGSTIADPMPRFQGPESTEGTGSSEALDYNDSSIRRTASPLAGRRARDRYGPGWNRGRGDEPEKEKAHPADDILIDHRMSSHG